MATKSEVQQFIAWIAPFAQQAEETYGVPASVFIAQAAEESSWGTKSPGNNLFGIKVGGSWSGDKQLLWTREEVNGVSVRVQAWFRKYASKMDSVKDRIKLMGAKRYEGARNVDPHTAARALQSGGYATNSNYANNLIKIMNDYGLTKYDLRTGGTRVPGSNLDLKFDPPSNTTPGAGSGSTPPVNNTSWTDKLGGNMMQNFLSGSRDIIIIILSCVGVILGFWVIAKGEELDK